MGIVLAPWCGRTSPDLHPGLEEGKVGMTIVNRVQERRV